MVVKSRGSTRAENQKALAIAAETVLVVAEMAAAMAMAAAMTLAAMAAVRMCISVLKLCTVVCTV